MGVLCDIGAGMYGGMQNRGHRARMRDAGTCGGHGRRGRGVWGTILQRELPHNGGSVIQQFS